MLLKVKIYESTKVEKYCTAYQRGLPRMSHLSWVVKDEQAQRREDRLPGRGVMRKRGPFKK